MVASQIPDKALLHQIQVMVRLMEAVSHHHHGLVLKLNSHKALSGFTAGISKAKSYTCEAKIIMTRIDLLLINQVICPKLRLL